MEGIINCFACGTTCIEHNAPIAGALRGAVGGFDFATGVPPPMILLCPTCTTKALSAVGLEHIVRK